LVTDAIVPVAGLGTRLLPATKSQPKEMLPVVGKPVVQYVVEELAAAGIERVLFVTGRGKSSIEDHFDPDAELIRTLRESGREELLARLDYERMGVEFLYTRQPQPLGLGDAVLRGAAFAERTFALALGDSILGRDSRSRVLARMADEMEARGAACALAVEPVPREQTRLRGIVAPADDDPGAVFALSGMVEKPAPADAPSDLAVAARYVLSPSIFSALRREEPDARGELQLTDAIAALIAEGEKVIAVRLPEGERRYDVGTVEGYCRTFIALALADPDFGAGLGSEARDLLA
jgi:UTP--glucose-1-phosphate uridylyltransferase